MNWVAADVVAGMGVCVQVTKKLEEMTLDQDCHERSN